MVAPDLPAVTRQPAVRLSPLGGSYRLRRAESPRATDTSSSPISADSSGTRKRSMEAVRLLSPLKVAADHTHDSLLLRRALSTEKTSSSFSGSRKKPTPSERVTDVLLGQPATTTAPAGVPNARSKSASTSTTESSSTTGVTGVEAMRWAQQLRYMFPESACFIPGRLYWAVDAYNRYQRALLQNKFYFFSTDSEFVYDPFYADFGPLNLGQTWRYCQKLKGLLDNRRLRHKAIVHYCAPDPCKKANAAYLMAAFALICLDKSPSEALAPFDLFRRTFLPFRDATYGICTYPLRIIDCLKGIQQAMKLGWFSFGTFDIEQYEHYEKILNGDLNWIVPKKFIAFSGPVSNPLGAEGENNSLGLTPQSYVPIFKKLGVTLVVRLNKKQYCRKYFLKAGINHVDLYFLDGSCPSKEIIYKFISICEAEPGAIAVHCKAGLGRTGTVMGCYAMKHYGFSANEWIGWNRVCRPGSVLGPQQVFLHEIQRELQSRPLAPLAVTAKVPIPRPGTQEAKDRQVAELGDLGQGDRLVSAKRQAKLSDTADQEFKTVSTSEFVFKKAADDGWQGDHLSPLYAFRSRSAQKYTPSKMQQHPNISHRSGTSFLKINNSVTNVNIDASELAMGTALDISCVPKRIMNKTDPI